MAFAGRGMRAFAAVALLFGGSPEISAAADGGVEVVTWDALPAEQRGGAIDVPAGTLKHASWGDLRMEIKHPAGLEVAHLEVFLVGDHPTLPQEGKEPKAPAVMDDKKALQEKKEWRSISGPDCPATLLSQGTNPAAQAVVVVGVELRADKKGGIVLYWRFGMPPKTSHALYEQWAVEDSARIVKRWGADLKPRVVPFLTAKKEETAIVVRKGKRVVVVVRFQPAVQGGDPYPRLYISVDPEAERADGPVELAEEKTSKTLLKFAADHATKSWDRKSTSFLVTVDVRSFLVRMADDPAAGLVYEVFTKPAE